MARSLCISEKRLLGWEPTETHTYTYDDAGRVATVTVTREPEWDDAERNQMLALDAYERGVCACGFHESLIDPTTLHVTFEDRVCPVCAGAAQYGRVLSARDEEFSKALGKDASPREKRPADGRRTFIVPTDPIRSPSPLAGTKARRDRSSGQT